MKSKTIYLRSSYLVESINFLWVLGDIRSNGDSGGGFEYHMRYIGTNGQSRHKSMTGLVNVISLC